MKKMIIAMLLILPLIIVATVLLSADIISHNVYIAVDGVELNYKEDVLVVELDDKQVQLVANVFPMAARNKEVYWEIENYISFGEDMENAVSISDNGLVQFNTYCSFDAVVTTKEGYKSDRLNIVVESGKAKKVEIVMGDYTLLTGDMKELVFNTTPIDGEITSKSFVSSNPDVVEVTPNGILVARKSGTAEITVSLNGGEVTDTKTFTVETGLTKYGTEFFVAGDEVSLSELGIATSATVISGGMINGDILSFNTGRVVLDIDGKQVIIKQCGTNDIVIQSADILSSKNIKLGGDFVSLKAVWKNVLKDGSPDVIFNSNNNSTATIDSNGAITPKKRGTVIFTAQLASNTDITAEIIMEIVNPIKYFRLNTNNYDDNKGILNESVIANGKVLEGNLVSNTMELKIVYPNDADFEDFTITSSDEAVAKIEGNSIVFLDFEEDEREVVVTVSAKHSANRNTPVSVRRKFKVVNAVSCTAYDDLKFAAENGYNISLANNITYDSGDKSLECSGKIYGNGFILDATKMDKPTSQEPVFLLTGEDILLSNIVIRCDDLANINKPNGMSGVPIIIGKNDQSFRSTARIEFSVLGNAFWGLEAHNTDLTMEGCIIRNISNIGLQFATEYNENMEDGSGYCNVTMENNIISNVIAPAISCTTKDNLPDGSTIPKQGKLEVDGFLDVYNWQDLTSANMLDRSITGIESFDSMLSKVLRDMLKKELVKEQYDDYVIRKDDEYFLHLGIITAGGLCENNTVVTINDDRFVCLPLAPIVGQLDGIMDALNIPRFKPLYLYIYTVDSDLKEDSEYTEDKWLYMRLRGEEI